MTLDDIASRLIGRTCTANAQWILDNFVPKDRAQQLETRTAGLQELVDVYVDEIKQLRTERDEWHRTALGYATKVGRVLGVLTLP